MLDFEVNDVVTVLPRRCARGTRPLDGHILFFQGPDRDLLWQHFVLDFIEVTNQRYVCRQPFRLRHLHEIRPDDQELTMNPAAIRQVDLGLVGTNHELAESLERQRQRLGH